jgi:Flp pilus assembly protein TadD
MRLAPAARSSSFAALLALAGCASVPTTDGGPKLADDEATVLRQQMAETLVRQRDYDLALPYLKDLLARKPRSARLHLLLGVVLREKGVYAAAEAEIGRALELEPGAAAAHAALGILQTKRGRLAEAERNHRRAVALAPGRAAYHNDLGFCLLLQRRYADARSSLAEAIRLDPGLRAAFNNLGFSYGLEGDDESARRAFGQGGSRAMALTNLGFLEEMRGHPAAARRHYEQALRVRPGYPPALRNLRALDPSVRTDAEGGEP